MPQGYKADGTPANATGKGGFGDNPENINRKGLTSKAKKAYYKAAELLAEAQLEQSEAYLAVVKAAGSDLEKLKFIDAAFNTFIKNIMDRVDGTPRQSVDLSSEDGSMSPKSSHSDAVLQALQAKHGKPDAE